MTHEAWPALRFADWKDTCETLHMWTQIVGKTRLALEPPVNHSWHVPLYVTARGLTTSAMPDADRRIEIELDFIDHRLVARCSDGTVDGFALDRGEGGADSASLSVSGFYRAYLQLLDRLEIRVRIWPMPVEVPEAIRFDTDVRHAAYDREYVHRFWHVLIRADRILREFRGRYVGKASPVHFFWGSFDMAVTRFSGRPAPPHPGGIPNLADRVVREAYSHEVSSCGFWPGNATIDALFYAYAYPEPEGFSSSAVDAPGATYDATLREFVLPYESLRRRPDADAVLRRFLQQTYEAAAVHGRWDRRALEAPTAFFESV